MATKKAASVWMMGSRFMVKGVDLSQFMKITKNVQPISLLPLTIALLKGHGYIVNVF